MTKQASRDDQVNGTSQLLSKASLKETRKSACWIPPLASITTPDNFASSRNLAPEIKLLTFLHEWVHDRLWEARSHLTAWGKALTSRTVRVQATSINAEIALDDLELVAYVLTRSMFEAHAVGNVNTILSEFQKYESSLQSTKASLETLPSWYMRVMLLHFWGYYKWMLQQHRESHHLFVKAMQNVPSDKRTHQAPSSRANEETSDISTSPHDASSRMTTLPDGALLENPDTLSFMEREVIDFLTGYLHLHLGISTHVVESVSVDDAKAHLHHALSTFHHHGQHTMLLKTLVELAYLHYVQHDLETAAEYLEQAEIVLSHGDEVRSSMSDKDEPPVLTLLRIRQRLLKAQLLHRQGQHAIALQVGTSVLKELETTAPSSLKTDHGLRWRVALLVAEIHAEHSTAEAAQEAFQAALAVARRMRSSPEPTVRALANLIRVALYQGDAHSATRYMHEIDGVLVSNDPTSRQSLDDPESVKKILPSEVVTPMNDPVLAEPRVESHLLELPDAAQIQLEWTKGLLAMEGYRDPTRALVHWQRALLISEDHEMPLKTASLIVMMALAYLSLGDVETAAKLEQRLDSILKEMNVTESTGIHSRENDQWHFHDEWQSDYTLLKGQHEFLKGKLALALEDNMSAWQAFNKAITTWSSSKLPLPHRYWKAKTILSILGAFSHSLSMELIRPLIDEGISTSQAIPNPFLEARCWYHKGTMLVRAVRQNYLKPSTTTDPLTSLPMISDDHPEAVTMVQEAQEALLRAKTLLETFVRRLSTRESQSTRDDNIEHVDLNLNRFQLLYRVVELLALACDYVGEHERAATYWEEAWELFQELHAHATLIGQSASSTEDVNVTPRTTRDELWWG